MAFLVEPQLSLPMFEAHDAVSGQLVQDVTESPRGPSYPHGDHVSRIHDLDVFNYLHHPNAGCMYHSGMPMLKVDGSILGPGADRLLAS